MVTIRAMRQEDIPFGLELCRVAGWNQLDADWRRLLALSPDGVVVAEDAGRPCGTASAVRFGRRIGWIGMILVHPDFRRRRVGTELMSRCVEHLRSRGMESIKLDATDEGRPVYRNLGFVDERPIHRYAGRRPATIAQAGAARPIQAADWMAISALDLRAFDADRIELLKRLAGDGPAGVVGDAGAVRAFGFARAGFEASFLGPVVAADGQAAREVVLSLLDQLPEGRVYWDLLPDSAEAVRLAEALGFAPARKLTRMHLGETHPGRVELVYAGAGFELG